MRIVSLNAWGGAMFDPLIEWLPGCGADVVCLQEVTRTPGLDGWTNFDDGERTLPQRANLLDDVRAALPRYQAVFVASDAGPVRDSGGDVHRQDFGLATFVDEQLSIVALQTAFVHGSFVDHADWPTTDRPRVAQAVRVIDRARSRAATVVHLHGLRDAQGKADTVSRQAQAERVATLVTEVRAEGDITVVCGDLNVLPDSETFAILGTIGLVDLVGTTDTRSSRYVKPVRHADYLLVSHPDVVRAFEVLAAPEVSDHRPLVLDI
jgi:endonuclease/exonuclease/phosphatase family metal-dependent hydrolase